MPPPPLSKYFRVMVITDKECQKMCKKYLHLHKNANKIIYKLKNKRSFAAEIIWQFDKVI